MTGLRASFALAFALLATHAAEARVFMTQREALAAAFPASAKIVRQTFFLTPEQISAAKSESGVDFSDQLLIRYAATSGDKTLGYAYFDTHRVRTLPESVMIAVTADGRIDRVEILSFDEPSDYFPKRRWIDQLLGRKLDGDLSLNRAIRPISGASLTGRAIVNASRKVLALHHALGNAAPRSAEVVP
ncbi:MAG TPA: FMN-binding protein [Thermoanaerobaculia bacterium]|nr:FMN-binding protein [Thermoanaerobaculia bacterium]